MERKTATTATGLFVSENSKGNGHVCIHSLVSVVCNECYMRVTGYLCSSWNLRITSFSYCVGNTVLRRLSLVKSSLSW